MWYACLVAAYSVDMRNGWCDYDNKIILFK